MAAVEDPAGTRKPPPEGHNWLHLTGTQGHQSCHGRGVRGGPASGELALRVLAASGTRRRPACSSPCGGAVRTPGEGLRLLRAPLGSPDPLPRLGLGRDGGQTLRLSPHWGRHSKLFPNHRPASVQKRLVNELKTLQKHESGGDSAADGLSAKLDTHPGGRPRGPGARRKARPRPAGPGLAPAPERPPRSCSRLGWLRAL